MNKLNELNKAKDGDQGCFVGFVLLSEAKWDKGAFLERLAAEWAISPAEYVDRAAADNQDAEAEELVFEEDGLLAAVSLMPAAVPNREAEENAANNYLWPEAAAVAASHKAHLLVAVMGGEAVRRGELFVKLAAVCAGLPEALGVYTSGTVFGPKMYREFAEVMREGELPLLNWVWFGLYQDEKGLGGYTYGLAPFGKTEIEVLPAADNQPEPDELRSFLMDMAYYVLSQDVTLQDGETIGFSEEQKLPITRSAGVALPGETLKIPYFA